MRPFDHAREITRWLDVLANAEVLGLAFEERVLKAPISIVKEGEDNVRLLTFGFFEPAALEEPPGAGATLLPDLGG